MANESSNGSWAAIGRFFAEYSRLEAAIDHAVIAAFDLHGHPAAGALTEIDVRKKLAILNAAVTETTKTNDGHEVAADWRAEAINIIKKVQSLADTRNSFAHARIKVDDTGSVNLSRGQRLIWTQADFDTEYEKIDRASRSMLAISATLQGIARTVEAAAHLLASARMSADATKLGPGDFVLTGKPTRERSATLAEPAEFTITGRDTRSR